MPRYRPFTQFCQDISAEEDVQLLEIGGQTTISLDILHSKDQHSTSEKGKRIYTMDCLQDPDQHFFATYQLPVNQLQEFIQETRKKGGEIEYVHE